MQDYRNLSTRQARFIDEYLVDGNGAAAAVRAGYAPRSAKVAACRMLTKDNPVRRLIRARQQADSLELGVTRQKVLDGLLAAVEQARAQTNPMGMIAGYREIARLLGLYEPERIEVQTVPEAQPFERIADAELLALIAGGA